MSPNLWFISEDKNHTFPDVCLINHQIILAEFDVCNKSLNEITIVQVLHNIQLMSKSTFKALNGLDEHLRPFCIG